VLPFFASLPIVDDACDRLPNGNGLPSVFQAHRKAKAGVLSVNGFRNDLQSATIHHCLLSHSRYSLLATRE